MILVITWYCLMLPICMLGCNVSSASLVIQAKYQTVFGASSVRIVTPDWIIHCVEAMSRIDEIQYHPRLLLSVSQEFVHQSMTAASSVHSLSLNNCQRDTSVSLSSDVVLDTSMCAKSSISVVPLSVIPTTVVSHRIRTRLKRIENESEYLTEYCHNPLKPFGCTKVCI